ncbi:hypothetical protein CLLI_19900 [Clostridium liquoris]|mgnify:FL=1|jgi:uncharacterized membrane protein YciS (DUF1049 family)|uniref:Uncharacterized protein n=1 Tax=Clostridium liquoris TaxID=1289519 RepID=A0A2T0B2E5_9CLOT|nr:hypothetical protein [Clostridium liquoris]PRR78070.1 hypothetical protein CLLI_19900 [Clostridium liquoris]
MKNIILYTLAGMGIAAIWGYFADLSKGNVAGFISKIFFVSTFIFAMQYSIYRSKKKYKKNNNQTNNVKPNTKSKKSNKRK